MLMQVMVSRPRSDLHINLPALRKLDNMLLVCPSNSRISSLYWRAVSWKLLPSVLPTFFSSSVPSIMCHPFISPCPWHLSIYHLLLKVWSSCVIRFQLQVWSPVRIDLCSVVRVPFVAAQEGSPWGLGALSSEGASRDIIVKLFRL